MSHKKVDRRVQRTRKILCDALIDLMLEKQYEKITVQEIIDRANVGRATFYNHYQDKDDLLLRGVAQLDHQTAHGRQMAHAALSANTISTAGMFAHSKQNGQLHQVMFKRNRENPILEEVTQLMYQNIAAQLNWLTDAERPPKLPIPILAHFITGGLLSVIHWWHDEKLPYTAEEMDAFFQQIAMPGVFDVLERPPNKAESKESL